jgi:hypothetical protein
MNNTESHKKVCNRLLTALVGSDHVNAWWDRPNKAFDNQLPKVVLESDPKKVLDYLYNQAYNTGGS